ncbi:hypothetical protein [Thermoactinomyces sp. DSM 45892]|uniref:hypothetical protein n=1 Tax=Thermoactinomyces sp. DSM 45892 TaxID=1882753 RepID=UPI00089C80F2|nr:hypothetical protein [Thermoactinomyces sp. DSM 45892]SDY15603.1 hypothetical protein SAMN05444416_102154 [Thermoactinomyces sp. DSM 45892]
MYVLYIVMGIFCLVSGINNLFFGDASLAVHYFLLLLFCHVIIFEFLKKPFEQKIYLLTAPLLVIDGIYQLFIGKEIFAGIIGLFFGFSLWQSRNRLKR